MVARRQLLGAGLSKAEVDHRLKLGSLLRDFDGVYRVGHRAPSVEARYHAAVFACGDGAVLSDAAAARLYELTRGLFPEPHVTTTTERRVKGVHTKRTRNLDPRDVTTHRGIPITTVARTLVDIAGDLDPGELARAVHEAQVKYRVSPDHIADALERRPNARGAGALKRAAGGDEPILLSRLERRFRTLLRDNGLPLPSSNERVGSYRVDCRWEDPPLTVELDGYRFHSSRHAWEQDRRREREARARGDEFRRYTYGDVYEEPAAMLAELSALLARKRASLTP